MISRGPRGLLESRCSIFQNSFSLLTRLSSRPRNIDHKIVLGLEYIGLAPGFVREVVDVYEAWEGKEAVPWKVKELMLNLRIEVSKRYKGYARPQEKPKVPVFRDTRLI
jgi:hypothetical protein